MSATGDDDRGGNCTSLGEAQGEFNCSPASLVEEARNLEQARLPRGGNRRAAGDRASIWERTAKTPLEVSTKDRSREQ